MKALIFCLTCAYPNINFCGNSTHCTIADTYMQETARSVNKYAESVLRDSPSKSFADYAQSFLNQTCDYYDKNFTQKDKKKFDILLQYKYKIDRNTFEALCKSGIESILLHLD